jgi:hypothetical protein
VFRKAQNKIQDPAKLKRLISDLLDKESWMVLSADIKGEAYEGLLERNAQDTQSGAIEQRQPTWSEANPEGRWRSYELEDLLARDKISLDLFWLKDDSLLDSDNLPDPDVITAAILADQR